MNKKLTVLFTCLMMLIGTGASAQITADAGYLHSSIIANYNGNKARAAYNGFYVGASYVLPLSDRYAFIPGLYFSHQNATDQDFHLVGIRATGDANESNLNIPLTMKHDYPVAEDMKIFTYVGATLLYGLSGEITNLQGSGAIPEKMKYYGDELDFSRVDLLLGGGLGYEYKQYRFVAGFKYGINNTVDYVALTRHRWQINIGVAYIF